MRTGLLKNFCKVLIVAFAMLWCFKAAASIVSAPAQLDTAKVQKPKRLKRPAKANRDKDEDEDGVDDNIMARGHQEFLQQRDPKLNRIPVERLLTARAKRDQFLNNIRLRTKSTGQQNNIIKTPGNAPAAPAAPASLSTLQWQERGPNNVGGRTRALMFDKGDSVNGYKRVFAGGVGGGLWVTSDITATPVQWTKINDFFDNIAISCIAQNPVNPNEIYAGTGEGFLNGDAIQGLGVWKSSDDGATWTHLTSTDNFKYVNAVLVDRNGSVYIAGETDVFVGFGVDQSTDGGNTWTNVINSSEAGADLQLAANGDVYASTGIIYLTGHIYISDYAINGSKTGNTGTWTNITPETTGVITPSTTSWNRIKLALAPNDPSIAYAFFETNQSTSLGAVQQYNKTTNTWTVETVPSEAFGNGQSWYSIAAAVDPNNANILYGGSLDAEKSADGGQTWTQYTHWNYPTNASNYVHADHHAYVYAPGSSSRLLMGTDGGIFYTVNANATPSFVNKNNGYDVTQFYSVALHPTSFNCALAGAQDNGSEKFSSAGVGPTTVATGGDGADVFIDQTNGNIQVTSYVYDQYYVSTDNGNSFNGLSGYGNGQFINPTDYDPATTTLYAGSASGDYYRAYNILSPAYSEVAVSGFNGANVTAVAVSPSIANRVYFGLDNGTVVRVDGAQTGNSNTGVVLNPNGGVSAQVSCVAVDPASEDHLLVTYSNYGVSHIFETKNATAATPTWTDVSGNLPDMPVRWVLFCPGNTTKAIIATELGVWTTDLINASSTTWDPTNTGLANVEVDMLKYRAADQTIAAATHGRGVFTSTISTAAPNANLSALTVSTGTLAPAFSASTTSYNVAVNNITTSITITPTAAVNTSTVKVNGTSVTSGTASGPISLNVGANAIPVVVTASDGVTTQTYTVTVNRAAASNDNLIALKISSGTLSPAFAVATTSYTASVANSTSSITVTPTTADPGATVKVNGTTVTSGTASGAISLSPGANTINVLVTAANGVTNKTYSIVVTRAAGNANLSALTVSTGALTPAFNASTTSYSVTVNNVTTSITISPTVAVNTSTVKVNGTPVTSGTASGAISLNVGANAIPVVVAAGDGVTTQTYTVTVNRAAASNDNLSSLKISSGTLTPAFAVATTSYTSSVANSTSSITVTPTAADPGATVKVNGTTVTSGTASGAISLAVGANTISVLVTAANGVTNKTYTIAVTRAANASLSALAASVGTITPVFSASTTSYSDAVNNVTTSVTVTPTTADPAATVTVNGTAVTSGTASGAISLNVGANPVSIVVTGSDGVTIKTYTLTVNRAAASNDNLISLKLSSGVLSPAFAAGTISYTASVANTVTSITVTPTSADPNATISVDGAAVTSGTASGAIALAVGSNTINVLVTAANGVTNKTYSVAVTRAAGGADAFVPISVSQPTDALALADDGIVVHRGVSPNGDGIEDFLQIDNISQFPDNHLAIMNQNGQLIYETKGYDNSTKVFDGHSSKTGQMQAPGTYFFALDYTVNGIIKHKTGFLVLKY